MFCDRCKKEINEGEIIKIGCNSHDLCDRCSKELMNFIFEYNKKEGKRKC